uniref:protein-tyrosine-phosphatase n=1 Tax=Laticauda laticaudata TaxID=8630 RepID=A0A8C5WRV4_LATLA
GTSTLSELQDAQEKDARQLSIAIARCYTMKNRHQDIMPYDRNRVILQLGKDDYINASRIEDLSCYCPTIIATQAPLVGTASDFWLMIYEQKVSLVVMLVSEQEMEKVSWWWHGGVGVALFGSSDLLTLVSCAVFLAQLRHSNLLLCASAELKKYKGI